MSAPTSRDLYARVADLTEDDLRRLAAVLELRGRHPQQVRIRREYLDQAPGLEGARVLDVGCGTGVVARDLARRVGPSGSVTGVDPSAVFVAEARRLAAEAGLENLTFAVADGRALGEPDGAFDAVVAHTVFCHVPELAAMVGEIARVVQPGGHLVVCDGDYASNLIVHPDEATTRTILEAWLEGVVHDPRVMRRAPALLREAGFELVTFDGHVHTECGPVDEGESFLLAWAKFAVQQALAAGAIGQAEAERWRGEYLRVNESGGFLGSVTY